MYKPSVVIETKQVPNTSQAHMLGGGGYFIACLEVSDIAPPE